MVVRVAAQAAKSGARDVIVATDHPEIARVVQAHGFETMMTRKNHATGTDRLAEVAARHRWGAKHVVVNVQGDEPLIPPALSDKLRGAARYLSKNGKCIFCDLIADEVADGRRIIRDQDGILAIAPFASRAPFETWLVPRGHAPRFEDASDATLLAVGSAVKAVMARIDWVLERPAYQLVLQTGPLEGGGDNEPECGLAAGRERRSGRERAQEVAELHRCCADPIAAWRSSDAMPSPNALETSVRAPAAADIAGTIDRSRSALQQREGHSRHGHRAGRSG